MSSFARLAVAATAVLAVASSSALGFVKLPGNTVTFEWTPSSGPVAYYGVYVEKDREGFSSNPQTYVSEPRVTLSGEFGETIRIRVVAWGWDGKSLHQSPRSSASEKVRFVYPAAAGSPAPRPAPGKSAAMPNGFDGDGRTSLLWRHRKTDELAVWFMDGSVKPRSAFLGTLSRDWDFVGSRDFDGDGTADLLLHGGRPEKLKIWFMNGGRIREAISLVPPDGCGAVGAMGDFDGDGYADLLWECRRKSVVWFMRGATVDEEAEGPLPRGTAACALDLDGDGRHEVIWRNGAETVAWWMVGSPRSRLETIEPRMKERTAAIGCGDADGDGFDDVLWYHRTAGISLWKMSGDGGVAYSFELPELEAGWRAEISGDFDGDGRANDILVRDRRRGRIEIWVLEWNTRLTSFDIATTGGAGMESKYWRVVLP